MERPSNRRSNVWGDESPTRAEVRRRRDLGQDARTIAQAIDISTQAVYRHLKALQVADDRPRTA